MSNGRALVLARVYRQDGVLVAIVVCGTCLCIQMQEGVVRYDVPSKL